jgi:hypothetical protein
MKTQRFVSVEAVIAIAISSAPSLAASAGRAPFSRKRRCFSSIHEFVDDIRLHGSPPSHSY